ncbi:MAG: Opr family porin [Campylobacteraceae bacterium]|nr:Opr family porin [Campylobacteraceae bacterium]
MKVRGSLVVASLLAGTTLSADSANIADALKNSKVNGELYLYGKQAKVTDRDDTGFGSGSFNIDFKTDSLYDFTLSAGSRANHAFWEVDGSEYTQEQKAILHTANVAYSHPHLDVVFGRQEINLEWASDYHEALVAALKGLPNTTIVVGYTQRRAIADGDEKLYPFSKIGDKGAFVVDVKFDGVTNLVLNPYIYYADDVAAWAGLKGSYDYDFGTFKVGGTLQYAQSDEDSGNDGSFLQAEARGSFTGVDAFLGLLVTDKDGGVGSIKAAGENVNPFEKGCQIFLPDARTIYLGAQYKWDKFELKGIFGNTNHIAGKTRELDLKVSYDLTNNLNVYGLFINGSGDDGEEKPASINGENFNILGLGATYSF